jgi:hypothetical protein
MEVKEPHLMIELIALALISQSQPAEYSETVNRFCAYVVGIPYASDNFTDEEWNRFVYCRESIQMN